MIPDDVDTLIAAAFRTHGDTDAASLARLEAFWRRQARQRRMRRRTVGVALAASVLVALGAWMAKSSNPVAPPTASPVPAPPIVAKHDPSAAARGQVDLVRDGQDAPSSPRSAGRLPSAYERLVFAAHARRRVDAEQLELSARVDDAIEQLKQNPDANPAFPTDASGRALVEAERLLLGRLRRPTRAEQAAIVRLLTRYGTARSLPALVQIAGQPKLGEAALSAIARLASASDLVVAVRQSGHAGVRQRLMALVLDDAATSPEAALGFLSLAADPAMRGDALASARRADSLPVDSLVRLLEHEDPAVRMTSASVLGAVGGPQVGDALIARLSRGERAPTEAWVALLACRGPRVEEFLRRASAEPRQLGQVNNARAYWARFVP